ncbi:hypothetical protein PHYPSEUDO_004234 [Phytophthora pseudosyringae]|uniref:Uncharacterized protein n=1 Tax=Phytophthora pseudosyringae TaxID=221518 RepID=A0A8T1VRR6_9STRA|nr:hypothetical protein PHYPSEUDO_004234 [Phytophthora pseudosyringae]
MTRWHALSEPVTARSRQLDAVWKSWTSDSANGHNGRRASSTWLKHGSWLRMSGGSKSGASEGVGSLRIRRPSTQNSEFGAERHGTDSGERRNGRNGCDVSDD